MLNFNGVNMALIDRNDLKVINIGSYALDNEEMVLSRNGDVAKLEPKVLAVLIYLCQNKNRYISMAELHEHVWQDRCVSDAAVRRAIGKLRLLFNDNHKDPKYIQSLPKRGYKLICQVSFLNDTTEAVLPPNNHAITNLQKTTSITAGSENRESIKPKTNLFTHLLQWGNKTFILLFIMIIALFFIAPIVYRISSVMP